MYLYNDVVMGLVWSYDCESYDSRSISTGKTSQVMIQSKWKLWSSRLEVGAWG